MIIFYKISGEYGCILSTSQKGYLILVGGQVLDVSKHELVF